MTSASNRPTAASLARYPVPIELITALYRADEDRFSQLVAALPEYGRARIAIYCAERDRLRPLGLKMARTCEETVLLRAAGGSAGASLFIASRVEATTAH